MDQPSPCCKHCTLTDPAAYLPLPISLSAVIFRLTKFASLLLLEAGRSVMSVAAGLLSAAAHRLLLITAHPAEVENAVTTLAAPSSTPHLVPAESLSGPAGTIPTGATSSMPAAGAGAVSAPARPTAAPAKTAQPAGSPVSTDSIPAARAPKVLSSILEEQGDSGQGDGSDSSGRVVSTGLAGNTMQASFTSSSGAGSTPQGDSKAGTSSSGGGSTAAAADVPADVFAVDIRDISKLWGIVPGGEPLVPAVPASSLPAGPSSGSVGTSSTAGSSPKGTEGTASASSLPAGTADSSPANGPATSSAAKTTSSTPQGAAGAASSKQSQQTDKPHKKPDLSSSIAHAVPAVPEPDKAAQKGPAGGIDTLAAVSANSIGLAHASTVNTAAGTVSAVKDAMADTPAGAAAADAAHAVQHAAGQAAAAAQAATHPGAWVRAGKAVLEDIQSMLAPPAALTTWDAPDAPLASQIPQAPAAGRAEASAPSSSKASSLSTALNSNGLDSSTSRAELFPKAAQQQPTQAQDAPGASTPASAVSSGVPAARAEGVQEAAAALLGSGPSAAPSGPLMFDVRHARHLGTVHELLHELLCLEDQIQAQVQRMHELQDRLSTAVSMQQSQAQQQPDSPTAPAAGDASAAESTASGTAKAEGTAAATHAGASADADAADDLDTSGIVSTLLGDLRSELRTAERKLEHLEQTAASILTDMVSAGSTAAAETVVDSGNTAGGAEALVQPWGDSDAAKGAAAASGSNGSSGSSAPSHLHGNRPALGVKAAKAGSIGSSQFAEREERRVLAQQLLAAGSAGLLGGGELNELLKRVARGDYDNYSNIDLAGQSRGWFGGGLGAAGGGGRGSGGGSKGGGGGGGGGSGGGGGGGRRRGVGGSGDEGHHHRGPGAGFGRFVRWLTHMSAKQLARGIFQVWLASVVLLGTFWYAYQLLYKMPLEEIATITHTAKHVAEAGGAVASKTASVAGHVVNAVTPGHSSSTQAESSSSSGFTSAVKAGFRKVGGFVKGLGSSGASLAQEPLRVAGSAAKVSYNGGKKLMNLLAGAPTGTGSTQAAGGGGSDGEQPSAAAVAAARVGVGAVLLYLANKTAGSGSGSSSGKKGRTDRADRAPSSIFDLDAADWGPVYDRGSNGTYTNSNSSRSRGGGKAAAAKAKAADVAHSMASQSASLASALSAMPSWFASNVKSVASHSNSRRSTAHPGGGADSTDGAVGSGGRGGRVGRRGRGSGAAAAAPAGVMGFEDGVLYALPEVSSDRGQEGRDKGRDRTAAPAGETEGPGGGSVGRGSRGGSRAQKNHGMLSDAEQQQLQVLYRSLSNAHGSWR